MRYFGTVDSFDSVAGYGQIKPDLARDNIRFQTTAVLWDKTVGPPKGHVSLTRSAETMVSQPH